MAMSNDPEDAAEFEELLKAARAGNREALGKLLIRYGSELQNMLVFGLDSRLQSKAGASDVVQNTYLDALRVFQDFRGSTERQFKAWLKKAARHNAQDIGRQYASMKAGIHKEVPMVEDHDSQTADRALAFKGKSPSSIVARTDQGNHLREALNHLESEDRTIILMRGLEEKDFDEIAIALDMKADTVRKKYARALLKLKRIICPDQKGLNRGE